MPNRTRSRMVRGGLLVAGALAVTSLVGRAGGAAPPPPDVRSLEQSLATSQGDLTLLRLRLRRADAIIWYSTRYGIAADVAAAIYDLALAEGVDPGLAFRLVKAESNFDGQATSSAGAVGYTQILPSTARLYEPGLARRQLYDRRTNLRLGFRFLRDLLERYDGPPEARLRLALLAYNRGPAKVRELLDAGEDPQNGYATTVMRGYATPR